MEDQVILKKLVRQLRLLNILVGFFGLLFIAGFIVAGIIVFKASTYLRDANNSIQKLQTTTSDTLNVQDQACTNSSTKQLATAYGLCK